jgi:MazG family protein
MKKSGQRFEEFIKIVERLRQECPWDREQTIQSLKPYLVEEVYEAIQAIDDHAYKQLSEELGDMLLHIVMLTVFAQEKNYFDINDVVAAISAKMIRRHPHVFSKGKAKTKEDVWRKWEIIKQKEQKSKGQRQKGMLDNIPRSLPALYRADKVQKRAARVGFDWDFVAGAWQKVHEELDEIHEILPEMKGFEKLPKRQQLTINRKIREEIGDLLFAIVNVTRKLDLNAEEVLQEANAKFMRRFSRIEKALRQKKLTIEEMDRIWDKVKAAEP